MVQWLGLSALTGKALGSVPGWGTKILQATWYSKKKKKKMFFNKNNRAFLSCVYLNYIIPRRHILKKAAGYLCILLLQRNNTLKLSSQIKVTRTALLFWNWMKETSHQFQLCFQKMTIRKQLCISELHSDKRPRRTCDPCQRLCLAGSAQSSSFLFEDKAAS